MPRHGKHPPFRWVSFWAIFTVKMGISEMFYTSVPTRKG